MRRLYPSVFFPAATAAIAAAGLLMSLAPAANSSARAGFTVDTTIDSVDISPGDGECASTDGGCSLRAAVMETNALAGANEITLPAGLYRLTIAEYGILQDSSPFGDLDVTDDLTITGDGAWVTEIDQRANESRILETTAHTVVRVSGVTIRGGNTIGYPGAPDASGGGILNGGTLTLDGVSVIGNSAGRSARGGGIYSNGPLTVVNSTISGNYAVYDGTGIDAGSVTIINSTISGNFEEFGGAGVWAGSATLRNATVAGNKGLNLFIGSGTLTVVNTIIAAAPAGQNCYLSGYGAGPIVSLGHNIDSDGSCGLSEPGDLSGGDPQILPLGANGGQTLTHALSPTSPAIDAGDSAQCPETDQRGVPRPVGAVCDIGAFEYGGAVETPGPTPTPPAWARADLNCDYKVDSYDALSILHSVAFGTPIREPCDSPAIDAPERGDINCNGVINAVDALVILRYVVGLPPTLLPGCSPPQ